MNCTLTVPDNPLSARGLATPYQLGDGCDMKDAANEGAFVEATILSPAGSLQVYDPLVVTAGRTPAVAPVPPTIARGSHVIIDIGSNGNNLVLLGFTTLVFATIGWGGAAAAGRLLRRTPTATGPVTSNPVPPQQA